MIEVIARIHTDLYNLTSGLIVSSLFSLPDAALSHFCFCSRVAFVSGDQTGSFTLLLLWLVLCFPMTLYYNFFLFLFVAVCQKRKSSSSVCLMVRPVSSLSFSVFYFYLFLFFCATLLQSTFFSIASLSFLLKAVLLFQLFCLSATFNAPPSLRFMSATKTVSALIKGKYPHPSCYPSLRSD